MNRLQFESLGLGYIIWGGYSLGWTPDEVQEMKDKWIAVIDETIRAAEADRRERRSRRQRQ